MKSILLTAISMVFGLSTQAQLTDTTQVTIKGKIVDASTQEPVDAKIKYESLPYGSKIGVFSGSEFSFTMEDEKSYMFMVEADGYAPYQETLKSEAAEGGLISTTIELKPTGINQLMRLDRLIFALGKATITEASHEELDELVAMLQTNENMQIQLEGHTDFRGNEKLNMELSEDRVDAVRDYLVGKGIDKRRIKTKAFGGSQPLSRGSDAESRRKNRRVEVRILSN